MKMSDLLAELDRDRPPCAVCGAPVTSKEGRLIGIAVDTGPALDVAQGPKIALLPFCSSSHRDTGRERMAAAKAAKAN